MKNKIKILFVAILMLASVLLISAGDIIFKAGNLDVSNNLAVNTDALYVDSVNKKVGIGITTPDAKLEVAGTVLFSDGTNDWIKFNQNELWLTGRNQNEQLSINYKGYQDGITQFRDVVIYNGKNNAILAVDGSAGSVGIGTASPGSKLDVYNGADSAFMARFGGLSSRLYFGSYSGYNEILSASSADNARDLYFRVSGDTSGIYLKAGGNVGIGTTTPSQKLDVAGYVKGTGLCIGADCKTSWPSGSSSQWTTSGTNIYYNTGNVGIGTTNPSAKLQVAGVIKATAFKTGDLFFNKGDKPVWRMYEDEEGLYVESLTTGKKYSVMLKELE